MNGSRPLLSRVADSLYWTSRYVERAGNVARYIAVNINLQLDLPLEPRYQWQPLVETSGGAELFEQRYGSATQSNVIRFLAFDEENPNSLYSCLRAARENARSIRETISSVMWEQLNSMYLTIQAQRAANGRVLAQPDFDEIRLGTHLFQGITEATMTRGEAWHFMRLGRKLERADQTSRILDVKYFILLPSAKFVGTPYDDIHWAAVLKSVSGFEMYRKKFGQIDPRNIVDFLVLDLEFPRSIHFCIVSADESLHAITGTAMGSFRHPSERQLGKLRAELDFASLGGLIRNGLHEYLDTLQAKINTIDASLSTDFVSREPQAPILSGQSQS